MTHVEVPGRLPGGEERYRSILATADDAYIAMDLAGCIVERQVLAEIKADPDLVRIPVVVRTTSKAEEDIAGSYDLHANCYINKPVDLDQFMTVVKAIEDFWLTVVRLPTP